MRRGYPVFHQTHRCALSCKTLTTEYVGTETVSGGAVGVMNCTSSEEKRLAVFRVHHVTGKHMASSHVITMTSRQQLVIVT